MTPSDPPGPSDPPAAPPRPARLRRCPVCGRSPLAQGARFCSERCQRVDLGRWLTGAYAIPAEEEPETDTDDPPIR